MFSVETSNVWVEAMTLKDWELHLRVQGSSHGCCFATGMDPHASVQAKKHVLHMVGCFFFLY